MVNLINFSLFPLDRIYSNLKSPISEIIRTVIKENVERVNYLLD